MQLFCPVAPPTTQISSDWTEIGSGDPKSNPTRRGRLERRAKGKHVKLKLHAQSCGVQLSGPVVLAALASSSSLRFGFPTRMKPAGNLVFLRRINASGRVVQSTTWRSMAAAATYARPNASRVHTPPPLKPRCRSTHTLLSPRLHLFFSSPSPASPPHLSSDNGERFPGDGATTNGFGRRSLHEWEAALLCQVNYPYPLDMRAPIDWVLINGGVPVPSVPPALLEK